jgi:hypothetical protein
LDSIVKSSGEGVLSFIYTSANPGTVFINNAPIGPRASVKNPVNATEGGSNGSFTITLTIPSSTATTITFTLTGTAINGNDYNTIAGTAVIPAGMLTVTIPVVTIDDTATEPTETVVITLQSATTGVTIDNTPQSLNIIDNDAVANVPQASVKNLVNATEGGNNGSFTITLTNPSSTATTIIFTLTGTAINGNDYSSIAGTAVIPAGTLTVTVPVVTIDDTATEPTETVVITLQSATTGVTIDNTPQSLTIIDNDAAGTPSQASVTNIINAAEGGTNGSFTITLMNPLSVSTTITFSLTGTAINGSDYTAIAGTAVIPAGIITVTVPVIPIDDNATEATETVVITLQSATNGVTVDNAPQTMNIADNDAAQVGITNVFGAAEGGTNGSFTLLLTNPLSVATTVTFSLTGTAINGTDYNAITGTAVIPAGSITVLVPVIAIDDNITEPTETILITLESASNGVAINNTPKPLNIADNDAAPRASVTNIINAAEGGSNGSFTITLTNPSSVATTILFTLTGTAINGNDYNAIPGTAVIPAGSVTVTVPVISIDDVITEPTETVVITLQSATSGTTVDNTPQALNIADNDAVNIISHASVKNIVNAIEGVANGSFTITLTNPSSAATTISFTLSGTAINGKDYNTVAGTAVIPPRALTIAIPVIAADDHIAEQAETVIIALQSANNGVTIDSSLQALNIFDKVVTPPFTPGLRNSFFLWGDEHKVIHVAFLFVNPDNVSIAVYDLNGRLLLQQSKEIGLGQTTMTLNAQQFPSGIYVVYVTMGGIRIGKKLFLK